MAEAAAWSLAGRRVIVIGGSSGIGFAIATLAEALGANVVVASSSAAKVDAAVGRLTGAVGATIDLRDEGGVKGFFDSIGSFDHLAITAGDWVAGMFGGIRDLVLAQARDSIEVRFWGALMAVKHASRTIAPDGSITLTGGMLAHRPGKGAVLAAAMGGAAEFLARGLAVDLAPIRVNTVCPGIVLTEHVQQSMPRERIEAYVRDLPLPRAASPDEAAAAYVYSMVNGYLTGQVLPVDGGGLLI